MKFSIENLIRNLQNTNTSTQNPSIYFFTVLTQAFIRTKSTFQFFCNYFKFEFFTNFPSQAQNTPLQNCIPSLGSFPSPWTVYPDFDSCYSHFMPYRMTPSVRHRAIEVHYYYYYYFTRSCYKNPKRPRLFPKE